MVPRALPLLLLSLARVALAQCDGDSCPATGLAQPPADETAKQPSAASEQPAKSSGVSPKATAPADSDIKSSATPQAQPAVGPHVVVVYDSPSVAQAEVLGVFTKLGVSDQRQAMQLMQMIHQKGSSVVVEGSHQACQQVAGLFEASICLPYSIRT